MKNVVRLIFMPILAFCLIFSGCTTQKQVATQHTIVFRDSAKIEKLSDSVRVLNIKNSEHEKIIVNQNERLKTFENAKVNEKITEFDKEGNITKTNERTIDYSKSTESEKVLFYQYLYDKEVATNDSLRKTFTEQELIWQNKEYDYKQEIKQKTRTKSFWWVWLIIGVAVGAAGGFFIKKYFGKIFLDTRY